MTGGESAAARDRGGQRRRSAHTRGRRAGARDYREGLWVCWSLSRLFAAPTRRPRLLFKGGTSLSKAYCHSAGHGAGAGCGIAQAAGQRLSRPRVRCADKGARAVLLARIRVESSTEPRRPLAQGRSNSLIEPCADHRAVPCGHADLPTFRMNASASHNRAIDVGSSPGAYNLTFTAASLRPELARIVAEQFLAMHDWDIARRSVLATNALQTRSAHSARRLEIEFRHRLQLLSEVQITLLAGETAEDRAAMAWLAVISIRPSPTSSPRRCLATSSPLSIRYFAILTTRATSKRSPQLIRSLPF